MRDPDLPLLQFEQVVATPHLGYVTREEYETQFTDIFDQILAFAAGRPINVVLPWSTCPIVPTLQCGFVRSNFCLAMNLLSVASQRSGGGCGPSISAGARS